MTIYHNIQILQFATGYTVAYFVYTIGTIVIGGSLNMVAAVAGFVLVGIMVAVIIALIMNTNKKMKEEYSLNKTK